MFEEKFNEFGLNNIQSDLYNPKFSRSALKSQPIFNLSKKDIGKFSKFSFADSFFDEKVKFTNNLNMSKSSDFDTPKKRSKKSKLASDIEMNSTNSKKNKEKFKNGEFVCVQGFEHIIIKGGFEYRERYKKSLKLRYLGEKYFYSNGILNAKIYLDKEHRKEIKRLGLTVVRSFN